MREVTAGVTNKWFISSSDAEGNKSLYSSYGYDGEFRAVNTGCNGNGNVSLRCAGKAASNP